MSSPQSCNMNADPNAEVEVTIVIATCKDNRANITGSQPPEYANHLNKQSTNKDGEKSQSARPQLFYNGCQLAILTAVILITSGLAALPIVFYHLPVADVSSNPPTDSEMCSSMVSYEGTVCKAELMSFSNCLPGAMGQSRILIQSDQSETVGPLLEALDAFASDECRVAALPFLCFFFFGLCDSTGRAYKPSSSRCIEISTDMCAKEWELAGSFNVPGINLPECKSLPNETDFLESCGENDTSTETSLMPESLLNETCACNEGFYCNNGTNVCSPDCEYFVATRRTANIAASDSVVILTGILGLLSGILVLAIAGIRRKQMCKFPAVFVVYLTILMVLICAMFLINFMDRAQLFCKSRDLMESVMTATPFCIISGMLLYYVLLQVAIWWIFHTAALFWTVQFPFHVRKFQTSGRVRYVYFTAVILGLVIPTIPVIATMIHHAVEDNPVGKLGFVLSRFPPVLCFGNNKDVLYYSLILPLNLMLISGTALLVLILWTIFKHHNKSAKSKGQSNSIQFGTPEAKILIVVCYVIVLFSFSSVAFTVVTRDSDKYSTELTRYFLCEQSGPSTPCSQEEFDRLQYIWLTSIIVALFGFFPLINLTFVVSVQEVKDTMKKCFGWIRRNNLAPQQAVSSSGGVPSNSS